MTERELQDAVIEAARLLGWRVAHFRPAQTARGWRTPVEADGAGFPDLVLVKGHRLLFVELKSDKGRLSVAQAEWLNALSCTGKAAIVWRPADWLSGRIDVILRGVRHGTKYRYDCGCRCDECRAAKMASRRVWRNKPDRRDNPSVRCV